VSWLRGQPQGGGTGAGSSRYPYGPAPEHVQRVLDRVDAKGAALPGYKGNKIFRDDANLLPKTSRSGEPVTYREWDVRPKVPGKDRGGERLVTGSDGSAYYTKGHYKDFFVIRLGR
jgi:guanyl-specific ribonuclease Sa